MIKEITGWYNLSQDLTDDTTYNIHIPKNCTIYFHYGTDTAPQANESVATIGENSVAFHTQTTGVYLWLKAYIISSKVSIEVVEQI